MNSFLREKDHTFHEIYPSLDNNDSSFDNLDD
jgi:hypothetical protein